LVTITGADQVAPPSVERLNQIFVVQLEEVFPPGSLAGDVHPAAPLKSVQVA
jgi:hypothetical protein